MSVPLATKQFGDPEEPIRTMPTRRVRLDKLIPTQASFDEAKVQAMARKEPSDTDKPVILGRVDGQHRIMDGHHRWLAAMERGDKYIKGRIC